MFRMTAFYPAREGAKFDWDYYTTKHFQLVQELCRPNGLVASSAQQCVPGPDGGPPPHVAIATMDFESPEAFQEAFAVAAPVLMGDIPNFTDIQPVITIGPVHA